MEHVTIVLSHPSEPRNIGAACRAMKNAGITRLCIVSEDTFDLEAARPLAVDAAEVLETARVVPTLEQAIAGHSLIAGTTRRTGQRRKLVWFMPWQLAEKVAAVTDRGAGDGAEPRAAIVFGNEQSGLSDAELELCHMAVNIPSHPAQPSLNLSHAVQIICYELYVSQLGGRLHATRSPIRAEMLQAEVQRITDALNSLGFHTQEGPQGTPALLRDVLGRAMLSREEMRRLRGVFEKLQGMHRKESP